MLKANQPAQSIADQSRQKYANLLKFGFVAVCSLLCLFQMQQLNAQVYNVDFKAFDQAVKSLITPGDNPYQPHGTEQSFHYPLWTSFLYLPIAGLEHFAALHTWQIANMLILLPVVWLLARQYVPEWPVWVGLPFLYCLSLSICSLNLLDGFPNILIVGSFSLMLAAFKAGRINQAGMWGTLGLVMKPQLTFLVGLSFLLWLITGSPNARRIARRWWLAALLTGLVLLAVSLLVEIDWIGRLYHALSTESLTTGMQEDGYVYAYITSTFPDWLNYLTRLEGWPVTLLYGGFAIGLLVIGFRRLLQWRNSVPGWLAVALALNVVLTPYARPYDYPFLLPPLFCLIGIAWQAYRAKRYRRTINYGLLVALVFVATALNRDFRWFYFQPLLITAGLLTDRPPAEKPAETASLEQP